MIALKRKAAVNGVLSMIAFGAIIFLAAGSANFWEGWLLLAVFTGGNIAIASVLFADPALLQRRMNFKESTAGHMAAQMMVGGGILTAIVVSPLDHRFAWSHVPTWTSLIGDALVAAGLATLFLVVRVNRFASATIEIAEDQRVISTGIYAFIRHPWYVGLLLLFAGIPLALGSFWSLLVLAAVLAMLVWRIQSEERFLVEKLPGYAEYLDKVRWRLLPGVY
jgi:protein-S-isoprenylcysteine O-methyltransferase Ste14